MTVRARSHVPRPSPVRRAVPDVSPATNYPRVTYGGVSSAYERIDLPRAAWRPDRLPRCGPGPGPAADSRDCRYFGHLAVDGSPAVQEVPRHRARPAGPRQVRETARRLLAGRLRGVAARSARRAWGTPGNGDRTVPWRRHRDAVRVPTPGLLRAAGADRQWPAGARPQARSG